VAVSPVVELVAMPLSGLLVLRFPIGRLMAVGLMVATLEYLLLSWSSALWQLYVIQAMDAWVVAVLMGLGLTYAQRLSPDRPGLASGVFSSTFGIAIFVGNLIGSASVPLLGVPHVFFIPTALCAVSLMTFLGIERASRRRLEPDIALSRRSSAG
jgi:SET family sugar efflux transporter-like MFS transporter